MLTMEKVLLFESVLGIIARELAEMSPISGIYDERNDLVVLDGVCEEAHFVNEEFKGINEHRIDILVQGNIRSEENVSDVIEGDRAHSGGFKVGEIDSFSSDRIRTHSFSEIEKDCNRPLHEIDDGPIGSFVKHTEIDF